jgi:hypothetical protein
LQRTGLKSLAAMQFSGLAGAIQLYHTENDRIRMPRPTLERHPCTWIPRRAVDICKLLRLDVFRTNSNTFV